MPDLVLGTEEEDSDSSLVDYIWKITNTKLEFYFQENEAQRGTAICSESCTEPWRQVHAAAK